MADHDRNINRSALGRLVSDQALKVQIGARGSKIAPDWLAVDFFDKSPLIDEHWDIHCLPIADNSVDCYICNAVLEHVVDADLAIYEMHRTLRAGGQIWVEVPFQQFYHAHPNDFRRWTLPGIKASMEDFKEVKSGRSGTVERLAKINLEYLARAIGKTVNPAILDQITDWCSQYEAVSKNPRIYDGVYFWGEKESQLPPEKVAFYNWKRSQHAEKHRSTLGYDPAEKLKRDSLVHCIRV